MNKPIYLEPIDPSRDDLLEIYNMLESTKVPLVSNKMGRSRTFGVHRAMTLGMIKGRVSRKYGLSAASKLHYDLYEALMNFGKTFVPFEFNAIQINHNLVCAKHKDKNNESLSVIISIGDYEGCNLVIEDHGIYDTNCHPLIFNGYDNVHYNTPLISGNKYSFVFFTNSK